MIEFATFFLGLVVGAHNLELWAAPGVARVELRLDDRKISELTAGPWRTLVDFGPALEPHDLTAAAFDGNGREVGRVRQWINRPRAHAEAAIVLEGGEGGRGRRARVTWHSISGPDPRKWAVTFDGKALAVGFPREFDLPPHVPEQVHFLRVELDFPGNLSAVAEVVFGGRNKDETLTELTAIPVLLTGSKKLPPLPALEGLLRDGAETLRVVAAEEGPAEVVFVLDGSADTALQEMGLARRPESRQDDAVLRKDQRFRVLWPVPETREHSGMVYQVFPSSEDLKPEDGGVLSLLNGVRRYVSVPDQKLAEAVAVAGVSATGRNRRRAVVLVLGPDPRDGSGLPAGEARRYLERMGVPFFIWCVVPPAKRAKTPDWGEPADVSSRRLWGRAIERLADHLEAQRIVWVEGRHLPQRVTVAGGPPFVALGRNPATPSSESGPQVSVSAPHAAASVEAATAVLIPAGSRLRAEPTSLSLALAVVDADLVLPVLDRRETWVMVRYESWKGWVEPGSDAGPGTTAAQLAPTVSPEPGDELNRVRALLRPASVREFHLLGGRLDLCTDVPEPAPGLVDEVNRTGRRFAAAYAERYGIALGADRKWTVVVFDREESEAAFRGTEPEGPAVRQIAVLSRRGRRPAEMTRELAREMARIASHAKISPALPAWLDEGIAADFALASSPDDGATVRLVSEAAHARPWPSLPNLVGSNRREFFAVGARSLNVAVSGLLVRYLVEGGGGAYSAPFRDFLDGVSRGEGARADVLLRKVGAGWDSLERGFESWLGTLKEVSAP